MVTSDSSIYASNWEFEQVYSLIGLHSATTILTIGVAVVIVGRTILHISSSAFF